MSCLVPAASLQAWLRAAFVTHPVVPGLVPYVYEFNEHAVYWIKLQEKSDPLFLLFMAVDYL